MRKVLLFLFLSVGLFAQNLPTSKNIDIYRGDSLKINFSVNGDHTARKLTFVIKASQSLTGDRLVEKKNIGGTGISATLANGKTLIGVTLGKTDTYDFTSPVYYYDLTSEHATNSGDHYTLISGKVNVQFDTQTPSDGTNLPSTAVRYIPIDTTNLTNGYLIQRSGNSFASYNPALKLNVADSLIKYATPTQLTGYSPTSHNHSLSGLTEKSYNSLTDKPDLSSLHSHSNKSILDSVTTAFRLDLLGKLNTAYGWGNHASAGYALSSALSNYLLKSDSTLYATQSDLTAGLAGKQNTIAYTTANADSVYTKSQSYTKTETNNLLSAKQNTLVSGTSIKTINGTSVLGSGDITISSAVNWGSIGGTLSSQTDLNSALNAKLDTTLATSTLRTNWSTAYTDRLKWDGGSTGLTPLTGRNSLELGSSNNVAFNTLALGGASIGTNALAITGTSLFGGNVQIGTGSADRYITWRSTTSWNYYFASSGDDFKIYDSDNLEWFKFTYTGKVLSIGANISFLDKNIALGTTTGTKIGTSTSQKLGFYNSTPIIQPSGNALTALSNLGLVASPTLTSADVGLGNVTNHAQLKSSDLDTDGTLAANSDTKIPSQKAVKTYADGKMTNPMTTAGDIIYGGTSGAPTRLAKGTAGQVLKMNSGATAPEWGDASGGTTILKAVKTADETVNNSSTYQDDDHLSVTLEANSNYIIQVCIFAQQITDGSRTPKIKFVYPTSTTGAYVWRLYSSSDVSQQGGGYTTNIADEFTGWFTALDPAARLTVDGIISTSSTAGTFKVQWAQQLAGAMDTKLLKGSYIILTKI